MNDIAVRLMHAHIEATNEDRAGIIGLLDPEIIAEYHHKVFGIFRLPPSAFAGTPFTGSPGEANVTRFLWCQGCDWVH